MNTALIAKAFEYLINGGAIETPRLLLRLTQPADAPALFSTLTHPDVGRWIYFVGADYTQEKAESWCQKAQASARTHAEFLLSVFEKSSGAYIGHLGLHLPENPLQNFSEVGYWLNPAHQGKGYATESLQTICAFAFDELKLPGLFATLAIANTASLRVLEKAGFGNAQTIDVPLPNGNVRPSFRVEKEK